MGKLHSLKKGFFLSLLYTEAKLRIHGDRTAKDVRVRVRPRQPDPRFGDSAGKMKPVAQEHHVRLENFKERKSVPTIRNYNKQTAPH